MITKTFICDICKQSVGQTELYPISVSVTIPKPYHGTFKTAGSKDICKTCLTKKGILVECPDGVSETEKEQKNKKTLEDKLLEILEDLGVQFQE